jgi:hypothetical protein
VVDLSALTEPVNRQAAIEYEDSLKERFGLESARRDLADAVVRGIFFGIAVAGSGFGLFTLGAMDVLAFAQRSAEPSGLEDVLAYYPPVAVLVVIVVAALWVRRWRLHDPTTRRYRLDRFARENDWTYTPTIASLVRPGMIFETGTTRVTRDVIRRDAPRVVEIGDHEYIPSPYRKEVVRLGYVGIQLDGALPHIVLDSRANDARGEGTSLRFRVDSSQRLGLEGDFDEYFTLYCPEGYERDALYLFSPDIMARFVDHAADFDVEIADDWMMLSSRQKVATLDPEKWQGLLDLVAALEQKVARWARWRDEQLTDTAPGGSRARTLAPIAGRERTPARVAAPGRRLSTRRFRWAPLLGFVVAMTVFTGPLLLAQVLFRP